MKRLLLAGMALIFAAGLAIAGPHAGGALLVHVSENALTFCEKGGVGPENSSYLPDTCEELVSRTDTAVSEATAVAWVIVAAFPPNAEPRLKGTVFGVQHNVEVIWHDGCGNSTIPYPGWPATNTGMAVTWTDPQTTLLTEVYTFVGYCYYATGSFAIVNHPSQGAPKFADNSVPPLEELVAQLGTLGFNQDGVRPCPVVYVTGACCFPNGTCQVRVSSECVEPNVWQGPDTVCNPNPCPQPVGACCFSNGSCQDLTQAACTAAGGAWQNVGSSCASGDCDAYGACCSPDGTCIYVKQAGCSPSHPVFGEWMGPGTVCSPNSCVVHPLGACCNIIGQCSVVRERECVGNYATWLPDPVCNPNPCPQRGACCKPTDDPDVWGCSFWIQAQCLDTDPSYHWLAGESCSPNNCPGGSPTIESTWGHIKSTFKD